MHPGSTPAGKKKVELSLFVSTFPMSPVIRFDELASGMCVPGNYYYAQKNKMD